MSKPPRRRPVQLAASDFEAEAAAQAARRHRRVYEAALRRRAWRLGLMLKVDRRQSLFLVLTARTHHPRASFKSLEDFEKYLTEEEALS